MHNLSDDLRRAFISLLKSPAFTITSVLILALGIGANAAIFSLVDRVLLRSLPFPASERLVVLWGHNTLRGGLTEPLSAPDFLDWQREAGTLEGMAAVESDGLNLTGGAEPESLPAGRVSWNFFRVIGVHPALGRDFTPEEDRVEGPRAVILSDELWKRRFGGDPGILGRTIPLNGVDTLVVGIMPPRFSFDHYMARASIFLPISFSHKQLDGRGNHFFSAVARLKPGATPAQCEAELRGIADRLAKEHPNTNANYTARVVPLREELVRNSKGTLLVLGGAVAFVLLIACANLMNLMLARSARRQRELAIRAALGASPAGLVWSALCESLVLGFLGGLAGLALGRWILAGLLRVLGSEAAAIGPMHLDARAVAFTFILSMGSAVAFGLIPALKAEGRHLADSLKEGKGSSNASHPRLRGLLVATETALATALLIGAGLMLRSLMHLQAVDPGYRPDHVLTSRITLPPYKYGDEAARLAFMDELRRRLEATPGVVAVGLNDTSPLSGSTSTSSYDVGDQQSADGQVALSHHITPGYFRAMGIPILQGRDLAPGEAGVLINRTFALRHFAHSNPLAGRVSLDGQNDPYLPVVGVVGDVRHHGPAAGIMAEMYFPVTARRAGGESLNFFTVVLRTGPEPRTMVPALRGILRDLDPDLPLAGTRTMEELLSRERQGAQIRSILVGSFAALALLLSGVGIYAVISFLTGMRTREIGVRMALGAQVRDVVRLVVGQGLRMALWGVAAGVAISLALGRAVDSQITGVRSWDPVTFTLVAAVLALVGILACLLPALRAARVDPLVALRSE